MKKAGIGLFMLLILLLTACHSNDDTDTVKTGTYIMEQTEKEEVFSPRISITESDINFSYDLLSSYWPHGTYSIEDGILTMTTDDDLYHYVFRIDGDNLIFQEDKSSSVSLIDDRLGVKIIDGAVFKLESVPDGTEETKNDIFTEEVYERLKYKNNVKEGVCLCWNTNLIPNY
jgi:hypothetical protein